MRGGCNVCAAVANSASLSPSLRDLSQAAQVFVWSGKWFFFCAWSSSPLPPPFQLLLEWRKGSGKEADAKCSLHPSSSASDCLGPFVGEGERYHAAAAAAATAGADLELQRARVEAMTITSGRWAVQCWLLLPLLSVFFRPRRSSLFPSSRFSRCS